MNRYLLTRPWFYAMVVFLLGSSAIVLLANTGDPAYVNALRAEGLPTSWRDLEAEQNALLPQDNGVSQLIEAMRIHNAYWGANPDDKLLPIEGQADLPEPWEPMPRAMKHAVLAYDAAHGEALQYVAAALERPAIHFDIDYSLGFNVLLPHLAQLRSLARMLTLHTLAAELRQDAGETRDALLMEAEFASSLKDPGLLIGELVRIAITGIFQASLERAVNTVDFSPDQLRDLQEALNNPQFLTPATMAKALASEQAMGVQYFDVLSVNTPSVHDKVVTSPSEIDYRVADVFGPWLAHTLSRLAGFQSFSKMAYVHGLHSGIRVGTQPISETIAHDFTEEVTDRMPSARGLMVNILLPALGRVYEANARTITQTGMARTALALLRYRHDHDTLPGTLAELAPAYIEAVPTDAFSGKDIGYIPRDQGFVLYSFGHDRDDDGGTAPPEGKNIMRDGDMLFEVRWQAETTESNGTAS